MATKLETFKAKFDKGITSEKVLGVVATPDYQCDNITEIVIKVQGAIKDLDFAKECVADEDYSDAEHYIKAVEYELADLEEEIEAVRSKIEEVRAWGQEWKDLAKMIIEKSNFDLDELL